MPARINAQSGDSAETLDIERLLDALTGDADSPPTAKVVSTTPSSEKMLVGDMLTLSASSDDPMDTFTWSTSDMAVATVDSSGVVTAVMLGTATITATGSSSGLAGTTSIDVVAAIIDVTPSGSTMLVGATQTMVAVSTNGSDTFSWTSSNTSVVTIDSSTGIASAADVGTATITATGSDSGESGTTSIDVVAAIIDVTPSGSTMLVGATQTMVAVSTNGSDTFSWTSSNTSVVTIDSSTGIASAGDVGTATITATGSDSGESGTTTISVITPTFALGLGECFITSLLQGTRYADKLDGIRSFRDTVLLESGLGCAVADAYYRLSPVAIRLLPRHGV